jgi:hypothetical protein
MTVPYTDLLSLFSGLAAEVLHIRDVLGLENSLLSSTFETTRTLITVGIS